MLPRVPLRQWVLSFPWPLRVMFAARPDGLTRVLAIVTRALSSAVIRRAGLRRGQGAQTGSITFVQRHGSALDLNVHLHLIVPDGAYTFEHDAAKFHRAPPPSPAQMRQRLDTVFTRVTRTLVRGGVRVEEGEQPYLELQLDSPLEQLNAAAVQYRIAVGPLAGRKTMTLHEARVGAGAGNASNPTLVKPFTVAPDGFSLNAALGCEAHERGKLERVCRYMARPPIAEERLSVPIAIGARA